MMVKSPLTHHMEHIRYPTFGPTLRQPVVLGLMVGEFTYAFLWSLVECSSNIGDSWP